VLTAFLIVLPFNQGFDKIHDFEKWVYTATFLCSITSMIFFSAPAAHHRLARPLRNRVLFKTFATRMILVGLVALSFALILITQLVVSHVIGSIVSLFVTAFVSLLILIIWWLFPLTYKKQLQTSRQISRLRLTLGSYQITVESATPSILIKNEPSQN